MSFYEKYGVRPLINASETYTRIGGSLMPAEAVSAMTEASHNFVDMHEWMTAVCKRAAEITQNEAAFITSGAAAGVVLTSAALLIYGRPDIAEKLPHIENESRKEILIYEGLYRKIVHYWHMVSFSGAVLKCVAPTLTALREAVNENTVGMFLFPAPMYEEGIPTVEETIPVLNELGVASVVDAAAQLPPKSNLYYYTKELGATMAIFSGGKHIKGPQATGLIVGNKEYVDICRAQACPNPLIGRGYKTGKEELAGFITALEIFVNEDPAEKFAHQRMLLDELEKKLDRELINIEILDKGRLGTEQPLMIIYMPESWTGEECNRFTRKCDPAVDVGVFKPENHYPENCIFVNAYNLTDIDIAPVACAINSYIQHKKEGRL